MLQYSYVVVVSLVFVFIATDCWNDHVISLAQALLDAKVSWINTNVV